MEKVKNNCWSINCGPSGPIYSNSISSVSLRRLFEDRSKPSNGGPASNSKEDYPYLAWNCIALL